MDTKIKKILFISHEASLSGAPILLLNLLKNIKTKTNISFDVLLIKDGNLYEDFAKIADHVFLLNPKPVQKSFVERNILRIKNILFPQKSAKNSIEKISEKIRSANYDLIYGNTVASLNLLFDLQKKHPNCVIAIHELSFALESLMEKNLIIEKMNTIKHIIAGSKAVADNLINNYHIEEKKIKIIHSFVEKDTAIQTDKSTLKEKLGITADELIIGIASSQELRKGTDLVPPLVKKISQKKPDLKFKFINLGGDVKNSFLRSSKLDTKKLGIEDYIIYINHTDVSYDYINLFDIFLLLSREDPFPLVMLTAAQLEKPIIAFKDSGGAEEFLENGRGIIVPYLDIDAFAEEIITLSENPDRMKELGGLIKTHLENNYSEEIIFNKNITFLENISEHNY